MRHEGFLVDLDNTLYDYESAHQPALIDTLRWLSLQTEQSIEVIESGYRQARKRIHAQLQGFAASHSRLLYFQYLLEQLDLPPYETAVAAEDFYWQVFFRNMLLRPDCETFLAALAPRPVIIITDLTAAIQLKKIAHLGLQKYISGIVTSEEAGCEKPHNKIFELAISKSLKSPTQLCMIGDSWDKDILGALQFNMSCFWLNITDQKQQKSNSPASPLPDGVTEFENFLALKKLVHSNV
jgi:putative hydrolase of the HAD superfamily